MTITTFPITTREATATGNELMTAATPAAARATLEVVTSTTGGANTVPKFDANGNLTIGTATGGSSGPGAIYIPDNTPIRWLKIDGSLSTARIRMWEEHDPFGGEMIIDAPYRFAIINPGMIQVGNNASINRSMHVTLVSGAATSTRTRRWPAGVLFRGTRWDGAESQFETIGVQMMPDEDGGRSLKMFYDAVVTEAERSPSAMTDAAGIMTGDLMAEFGPTGIWSPGLQPAPALLDDGATVTQVCDRFKAVQFASVTIDGNRSLALDGVQPGMRGTIMVTQGIGSPNTLSFLSGVTEAGFALSSGVGTVDQLDWVSTGAQIFIRKAASYAFAVDAIADAFFTRAAIVDAGIESAINNLVVSLKANSLLQKFNVIYPFVGGTSQAHAQNLVADANHITWGATEPTHDANGITGDGTAAHGISAFKLSSAALANSVTLYTYCRTQVLTAGETLFGARDNSADFLRAGITANTAISMGVDGINRNQIGTSLVSVDSDYRKHLAGIRTNADLQNAWANEVKLGTSTAASLGACDMEFGILHRNLGATRDQFTSANLATIAIGQALTDAEYATFRGIIDTFQAALGRANP